MNIPRSAIEPFGVIGIPTLDLLFNVDDLNFILDEYYHALPMELFADASKIISHLEEAACMSGAAESKCIYHEVKTVSGNMVGGYVLKYTTYNNQTVTRVFG